jgi:hypothetical protein
MTITVIFDVQSTAAQYDQIIRDLTQAGFAAPKGRLYHAAQPDGDRWCVVDVWESSAAFETFGKTLIPILARNGVPAPGMKVLPTHNVVRGE